MLITFTYKFIIIMLICYVSIKLSWQTCLLISSIVAYTELQGHILNDFTWTHCARGLFNTVWFKHVAADWAEISDTPTKQEKTHLKPRCTPFPGNMLFSSATVAKHRAPGEPELAPLTKTTPEVLIEYFKENLVPTLFFYSSTPLESLTWNMLYKFKIRWVK